MKKIKILALSLSVILCALSAAAQEPLQVVSSASMFADMASVIGGDKVKVTSIVPIGGDPHLYTPSPSDAQLVASADVILINGLTFEGWIAKLIANSTTTARVKTITEGIEAIGSNDYANAYDPHAWMTAANGQIYIDNILAVLTEAAPEHKAFFEKNHAAYRVEIGELDAYIRSQIDRIPAEKRILITSHDAFKYYGLAYGLTLNAIKGISTEEETQTSDIMRVTKAIKDSGVPAIFIETTINPKMIQQIAADTGVKVGGELYADSLGPKGSKGDSYVKMLRANTDIIVNALSQATYADTKIDAESGGSPLWMYALLGLAMLGLLGFMVSKFK